MEILEIVGFEFEFNQGGWNQESLNLSLLIQLLWIWYKSGIYDVGDHLKSIQVIWMCTWNGPNLGFHGHAWGWLVFQSNMCIWHILGGLWMLPMLIVENVCCANFFKMDGLWKIP